jgi:hypothetical protein
MRLDFLIKCEYEAGGGIIREKTENTDYFLLDPFCRLFRIPSMHMQLAFGSKLEPTGLSEI